MAKLFETNFYVKQASSFFSYLILSWAKQKENKTRRDISQKNSLFFLLSKMILLHQATSELYESVTMEYKRLKRISFPLFEKYFKDKYS